MGVATIGSAISTAALSAGLDTAGTVFFVVCVLAGVFPLVVTILPAVLLLFVAPLVHAPPGLLLVLTGLAHRNRVFRVLAAVTGLALLGGYAAPAIAALVR